MIMTKLMISVLVGGGIGAALGYFGKCSSGTCPLTSTWWRGALYGAVLGCLFYFISGGGRAASMNKSTANIKLIKEGEFDAEVVQSSLPVVVDFYATWCGPCKLLAPMLDELAGPLANQVKFVKINVDEAPSLSQRFDIQAIPTLIFFKNGKVVDRLIGLPSKDTLKMRLGSLAGPGSPAKNSG
jgi:thioredoxin 1